MEVGQSSGGDLAATTAVCNVVGLMIAPSPIPNWAIPMILPVIGGATLCLLSGLTSRNAVNGFLMGWAAVGAHQTIAKVRDVRHRYKTGNTEIIPKP